MSQVLSSAGRQSTFGPHIADVVPALGGRLAARGHAGRDDLFLHHHEALRTDSAMTAAQATPTVFVSARIPRSPASPGAELSGARSVST
jgi:hypothetical protein